MFWRKMVIDEINQYEPRSNRNKNKNRGRNILVIYINFSELCKKKCEKMSGSNKESLIDNSLIEFAGKHAFIICTEAYKGLKGVDHLFIFLIVFSRLH